MTIRFQCPSGHRLTAPDHRAGQRVRCPRCRQPVSVPGTTESCPADSCADPEPEGDKPARKPPPLPEPVAAEGRRAEPSVAKPAPAPKEEPSKAAAPREEKEEKWAEQVRPGLAILDEGPQSPSPSASSESSDGPDTLPPLLPGQSAEKKKAPLPKADPTPPAPMAIADFRPVEAPPARSGRRSRRRDHKRAKPEEKPSPWSTAEEEVESAPPATAEPSCPTPVRPRRDRGRPKVIPPHVYRPDAGKIATVRGLAIVLSLVVAFSICPAVYAMFSGTGPVPAWSRLVLLIGGLQMAYILWMVAAPDWASVWVVMLAFAAISALYGMATGVALAPPASQPELLGMSDKVLRSAKFWCAAVTATMALATYLCGRNSARWRRSLEREKLPCGNG